MILKLEPNQPYTLSLKYPTGKQVDGNWGPQLRWILGNGDLLYTPMELGPQIEDLGIRPGQSFQLTKIQRGKSFEWRAERIASRQGTGVALPQKGPQPIASLVDKADLEPYSEPQTPPSQAPVTRLEDALMTAVAAAAAAEKFASSIGYTCRFSPTDIKAMGISVLIASQQGSRHAA